MLSVLPAPPKSIPIGPNAGQACNNAPLALVNRGFDALALRVFRPSLALGDPRERYIPVVAAVLLILANTGGAVHSG